MSFRRDFLQKTLEHGDDNEHGMQGKDSGEMVLAWTALNKLKMHKDLAGCFPTSDLSAVKKHWF